MGFFSCWELGNVLLSHGIPHTIIGDDPFHCPVRDGKEWDQVSIVTKQFLCLSAYSCVLTHQDRVSYYSYFLFDLRFSHFNSLNY